jgi:hypothetical protein
MMRALQRSVIIGNSGSGKTWLAGRMAAVAACPVLDLDRVYWDDQALLKKRPAALALQMTADFAREPAWVIEGVFGWLADVALPQATALIWLDLPWEACRAGIAQRGVAPSQSQAEYDGLLAWAERYWHRPSSSSHAGHHAMFERFAGAKIALHNRDEVGALVGGLVAAPAGPTPAPRSSLQTMPALTGDPSNSSYFES